MHYRPPRSVGEADHAPALRSQTWPTGLLGGEGASWRRKSSRWFGLLWSVLVLTTLLQGQSPPMAQAATTGSTFVPTSVSRIADTRTGAGLGTGPLAAGETRSLKITGVGSIPSTDVTAVLVNIVSVLPSSSGWIVVHPRGSARPAVTHLNTTAGESNSNLAIVQADSTGYANFYSAKGGHLVVETQGFFKTTAGGSGYTPIRPGRVFDTRTGQGGQTGALQPDETVPVSVTAPAEYDSTVKAVFVNISVTDPTAAGRVSAWSASNLTPAGVMNYNAGEHVTAAATVPVSADGRFLLKTQTATNVVVDLLGYFKNDGSGTGLLVPLNRRVLDTRTTAVVPANGTVVAPLTDPGGIPRSASASSAVLNLHVLSPQASGTARVWANGTAEPTAGVASFTANEFSSNLTTLNFGSTGAANIHNVSSGEVHFVLELQGYFVTAASAVEEPVIGPMTDPGTDTAVGTDGEESTDLTDDPEPEDPIDLTLIEPDTPTPTDGTPEPGTTSTVEDSNQDGTTRVATKADLTGDALAALQEAEADGMTLEAPLPADAAVPPPPAEGTYSASATQTAAQTSPYQSCEAVQQHWAEIERAGATRVACTSPAPPANSSFSAQGLGVPTSSDFPTKCLYQTVPTQYFGRFEFCKYKRIYYDVYETRTKTVLGRAHVHILEHTKLNRLSQTYEFRTALAMQGATGVVTSGTSVRGTVACRGCSVTYRTTPDSHFASLVPGRLVEGYWRLSSPGVPIHYATHSFSAGFHNVNAPGSVATARMGRNAYVRCENERYFGTAAGGCSFPNHIPTFDRLSLSDQGVAQSAAFVWAVQRDFKYHWGANYTTLRGLPLHRLTNYDLRRKNNTAACGRFKPNGIPGDSCDEYPFRSTQEGAYTGRLKYPGGAFIGHVNGSHNSQAGSRLGGFYKTSRVVDGDPFWVAIRN